MSARVAVVVPVHNGESFLGQTLDSLLAQSYRDWVGVIVDDASRDGSAALAAGYAERHPRHFVVCPQRVNLGVVGAREAGIAAAGATELIVLLDHDDLLREDYLDRMVALYERERASGRRIGIVGCDARLLGPAGFAADTWGQRLGTPDAVDLDRLIHDNPIFARALFSRAAYEEVGGLEPRVAGSDDHDLWLRIAEAGYEVATTREALAVYRIHAAAFSQDRVAMTTNKLAVYERALARGRLTRAQRRAVRRRMRHYRATRARWRAQQAWQRGERAHCVGIALTATPVILAAMIEDPRWVMTRGRRQLPAASG